MLVAPGKGGTRIAALNRAAQHAGLAQGELLSNARSKVRDLQTRDADPAADAAALRRLALWCLRYTPIAATWDEAAGADGLFLDITGCAHLLGGEERLLADLAARLRAFGLVPRLGLAGTAGAAWAVAHYGEEGGAIVAPGGEKATLQALPLAALRLDEGARLLMRRLGLRRIGEVMRQPRAPFAARFHADLLLRLDQALGHAPEPLVPVIEPPVYRAQATFVEPIMSQEHVLEAATRLLETLVRDLERAAVGARLLRLLLFRVDGEMLSLDLGLAAPSRDARHIAQLIGLRLHRLGSELEADFGFEAAAVHVLVAESLAERQDRLGLVPEARYQHRAGGAGSASAGGAASTCAGGARPAGGACTADRQAAAAPGQGCRAAAASAPDPCPRARRAATPCLLFSLVPSPREEEQTLAPAQAWREPSAPRPLLMLEHPETAEVLAVVPDGPPRHFRWRGVLHQVAEAQGPERIAPEWWRRTAERTRDYYIVEDVEGRRFWLYRDGLYGESGGPTPQWFVHGVFA